MKVMVIGHTYMTAMSQEKTQALARLLPGLVVVTPLKIKDTLRTLAPEQMPGAKFILEGVPSNVVQHNALRIYAPGPLKGIFQKYQPDVVLIEQEPFSISTYQIMRLKKKFRFKAVILSNQNIYKNYPPPFRWMESYVLRHTDLFLGASASVLPVWLRKGIAPERAVVSTQVGVSLKQFFPQDPTPLRQFFGIKKWAFGYAGRFVEEKGVQILLEAYANMKFRSDCEIVLIGAGPYQPELERQMDRLGIRQDVRIIQGIKHDQMPQVLNAIDALVLPSLTRSHWREQFGHVIIEALACGKPVLGSDTLPIPKAIETGGMLFAEGNSSDLSQKMDRIHLDRNLYLKLSHDGQRHVQEIYTNETIASELLDHFARLFETSRASD